MSSKAARWAWGIVIAASVLFARVSLWMLERTIGQPEDEDNDGNK